MTRAIASIRGFCAALLLAALSACGGGGGGGDTPDPGAGGNPPPDPAPMPDPTPDPPPDDPPPDPPPPDPPTQAKLNETSRFLAGATFGATFEKIDTVARQDSAAWLEAQFEVAPSLHQPIVEALYDELMADPDSDLQEGFLRRMAWWTQTMTAPDELRQRVAYALTQIFVVSDSVTAIFADPRALSSYYDMLLVNAFGNYRDLLYDVTLHPVMGLYLSHVNNAASDPTANIFPDENYAREVMQLFSIGLFELNADGTLVLDGGDRPVPTYDNADIREFARIFTGLSWAPAEPGGRSFFGKEEPVLHLPMVMFEEFHEGGAKQLLNGTTVPDGQSGLEDIEAAVDNLFNHPNTGPFFGRLLIQRLTTSNPSPAYVARVAAAFADNGDGVRGDMQAVLRAVLLDAEVFEPPADATTAGKLREPFLRYVALNRALNATSDGDIFANVALTSQGLVQQNVLSSPSVFNFYLPDHAPGGAIADAGLVAPEFQITTASTVVGMTNLVAFSLLDDSPMDIPDGYPAVVLDLSDYEALVASDPEAMIDRLDTVFTYGEMSETLRDVIRVAIALVDTPDQQVRFALYALLTSPDYAVRD